MRTPSEVLAYERAQTPPCSAVCKALRKEISSCLPKAIPRIYHRLPVWFVGENAVVGYRVTAKHGVTLLFWNGQAFKEPDLKSVGSFEAAQIQYQTVSEIKIAPLRRWLKKAGKDIWDFAGLRKKHNTEK